MHRSVGPIVLTLLVAWTNSLLLAGDSDLDGAAAIAPTDADGAACPYVCEEIGPSFEECFNGPDTLTGDWFGHRSSLADYGITVDGDVTQFYQGVAHGGRRERFRYAGHGDYLFGFDFDKMAGWQGWSLQMRACHRWGQALATDAGVILPTALHAATPTLETEDLILTNVLFTKVLNENLTVFFGKLDTLDGDRNPFASGRGKTQFLNTSLLLPVNGLPTVPLATLGAGAVLSVQGLPFAQVMVLSATDTVTTSGFDELFEDGALIVGSVNVPLPITGKLGVHTFSGAWNSKTFTSLDQDARLILPRLPLRRTEGSWVVWWSGAQYLYQDPCDPMKGWGLFARAGASDGEVNPVRLFFNVGIGGYSPLPGRENDRFGIGWYFNRFSDDLGPIVNRILALENHSTGVEIFYNWAVTPYFHVTPDLQVIEPGTRRANTALLVGGRVEVDF